MKRGKKGKQKGNQKRKKSQTNGARKKALLQDLEKLAALGRVAAGISHEINTPLGTISLTANQIKTLIKDSHIDREKIHAAAVLIDNTSHRISNVVRSMLALARTDRGSFMLVPVHDVIEEALNLCRQKFKNHGIQLLYDPADTFKTQIECQMGLISQVLLNLINNAMDAIENLGEKWIRIEVKEGPREVRIRVIDSGLGIDPKFRKKLMQPFFTTKERGKGTGLGLSISQEILKKHQGTLTLNQEHDHTCFEVKLPKINRA